MKISPKYSYIFSIPLKMFLVKDALTQFLKAFAIVVFFITLQPSETHALRFAGNQSHKQWQSFETKHFNVHYEKHHKVFAQKLVTLGEQAYERLTKNYRIPIQDKIDLVVNQDLFSNGSANSIQNILNIWITDWDFKLRSTHPWLEDVMTHELAHLFSIRSGMKLPPWFFGFSFSYQQSFLKDKSFSGGMLVPFSIQPAWFAEGVAQLESEAQSYDSWDSHRDMVIRVAALENAFLPMSAMKGFGSKAIDNERGPYTQGFSLVRFIREKWGEKAIQSLWSENARVHRWTFDGSAQKVLGVTEEELYQQWVNYEKAKYKEFAVLEEELQQGKKLTSKKFFHDYFKIRKDRAFLVQNISNQTWKSRLLDISKDSIDSLDSLDLPRRNHDLTKPVLQYGYDVFFYNDSSYKIAYVSSENKDRFDQRKFDIYIHDSEKNKSEKLTFLENAIYPSFSLDGKKLTYVKHHSTTAHFSIHEVLLNEDFLEMGEAKELYSLQNDSLIAKGVFNPSYSPDGKWVLFDYYDGQSRNIARIPSGGGALQGLVKNGFDNRNPIYVDDKTIYYSSDQSGRYELYSLNIESSHGKQITRMNGGAFRPEVSAENKLTYIQYDKDGFSAYQLDELTSEEISSPNNQRLISRKYLGPQDFVPVKNKSNYKSYPSRLYFLPIIHWEENSKNIENTRFETTSNLGFSLNGSDPLEKNFLNFFFLIQKPDSWEILDKGNFVDPGLNHQYGFTWLNKSTPLDLQLEFMRMNRTGIDTLKRDDNPDLNDTLNLYAVRFNDFNFKSSYSPFKMGDMLALTGGYSWSSFDLYEANFFWDYYKSTYLQYDFQYEAISPRTSYEGAYPGGFAVKYGERWSWDNLFRQGNFSETFRVNANGIIEPLYRKYNLWSNHFLAHFVMGLPFLKNVKFKTSVIGNAVLWNNGKDTLDDFLKEKTFVPGYPLLQGENYTFEGENTFLSEFTLQIPLYKGFKKSWWVLNPKALILETSFYVGKAWDGKYAEVTDRDSFKNSYGVMVKAVNTIFNYYPFMFYGALYKTNSEYICGTGSCKDNYQYRAGVNLSWGNALNFLKRQKGEWVP